MLVQRLTSQLQYGACGHLICTPVSCALAVLFLNGGCKALTPPLVHDTMVASHQLVMSTGRAMMMLSEIQDRLPVEYAEVRVHTHTHTDRPTYMSVHVPLRRWRGPRDPARCCPRWTTPTISY
jgi:hypothetical protein